MASGPPSYQNVMQMLVMWHCPPENTSDSESVFPDLVQMEATTGTAAGARSLFYLTGAFAALMSSSVLKAWDWRCSPIQLHSPPAKFQRDAGRMLWLHDEASHTREPSFIFQTQKATKNCHLFPAGFVQDQIILRGVGKSEPRWLQ